MAALPPPREVPATPAVQAADIRTLYDIQDSDEKGRGAFSRVVVGYHLVTHQPRAIKIMEKTMLVGKKAEMVAHEKEILRRTRHPNIIFLHETIQTPDRVYMVMELMKGDLFEYIVKNKKLSEGETAVLMKQLLDAVAYLHKNSIVHRDIKPENILINSPDEIKLADFGLAKVVQDWDVKSTPCGTSFYIAPEVIRGIESNGARPLCTTREEVKFVDIWSCGVVMFIMLAGRPPFVGQVKTTQERRALLAKIDRGVLFPDAQWATVSASAKDLIMRLLAQDTSQRITAAAALCHQFFKEHLPSAEAASAPSVPPATAPAAAEGSQAPGPTREELANAVNTLQVDLVETGDKDGDVTSYNVEVKTGGPARPAAKLSMKSVPKFDKNPAH